MSRRIPPVGVGYYTVTAERDGADSSDAYHWTSMADTVRDMVVLGSEPPDSSGPIGWTLTYTPAPGRSTP